MWKIPLSGALTWVKYHTHTDTVQEAGGPGQPGSGALRLSLGVEPQKEL